MEPFRSRILWYLLEHRSILYNSSMGSFPDLASLNRYRDLSLALQRYRETLGPLGSILPTLLVRLALLRLSARAQ